MISLDDALTQKPTTPDVAATKDRNSEGFVDALLNPRPVNDHLRDTVLRYRERTGV